jgi:hypothetical protein
MNNPYDLDQDGRIEGWEIDSRKAIDAAIITELSTGEGGWRNLPFHEGYSGSADLVEYTCSCAEWTQHRNQYPERDIRRLCVHLRDELLRSDGNLDPFTAAVIRSDTNGAPVFSSAAQYLINGHRTLLLWCAAEERVLIFTQEGERVASACLNRYTNEWASDRDRPKEDVLLRYLVNRWLNSTG